MRMLGWLLWVAATAIGSAAFWLALGQLAFAATGVDPLDLFTRGELGGNAIGTIVMISAGIVIYAILARSKFVLEQARQRSDDD